MVLLFKSSLFVLNDNNFTLLQVYFSIIRYFNPLSLTLHLLFCVYNLVKGASESSKLRRVLILLKVSSGSYELKLLLQRK